MDAERLQEVLAEAIELWNNEYGDDADEAMGTRTYEEAGVLTKNLGLVITDSEGNQHQVTILGSFRG